MDNNKQNLTLSALHDIYTYRDIAKILHIGTQSARTLMKTTDFPSFKLGVKTLVRVQDFNAWFENVAGKEIKIGVKSNLLETEKDGTTNDIK